MDTNFDNAAQALLAMFKLAQTEGWLDIMHKAGDENKIMDWIFFLPFIFIGCFFLLNLFDGIVIDNFYREKDIMLGIEKLSSG